MGKKKNNNQTATLFFIRVNIIIKMHMIPRPSGLFSNNSKAVARGDFFQGCYNF